MQDPLRRRELAQIHIAKKDLGLSDDDYRMIIRRLTKEQHDSAAALTGFQRRLLLTEFRRLGWKSKHGHKPTVTKHSQAVLAQIEALLAETGRSWAYADGIAKQMFQIERLGLCAPDQLRKVQQALLVDQRRRQKKGETHGADRHEILS